MVCIYSVNIDGFEASFEYALQQVSVAKREEVLRFRQEKDRHRKVISLLLLQHLVKRYLDLDDYTVLTNSFGKPYLENYQQFHYNVSHSGDWVVVAVGDKPLGVDIEVIKEMRDFIELAKRFYSEAEYKYIVEAKEESKLELFFDIWTKKESLIKAVGKGLSIPLKSFTVPFGRDGIVKYDNFDWHLSTPEFSDKMYKIAISLSQSSPINTKYLKIEEILSPNF